MDARLSEGSILEGKYRIVRVIGQGGMGVVYEAEHMLLKRRCAVKVLAPAKADDELMKSRFKTEARSAANIVHRNVVEVLDFGISPEGLPFFVMEYLEGESLGDRLKRVRRLAPAVAVEYTDQILRALSKAHKLGVVHRDLKPDNIYIARVDETHETIKVLDFGIVKLLDSFNVDSDTTGVSRQATLRGVVLGTPGYIAPESIYGLPTVDGRTDLFSVGVLLYVMLTGKRPFTGSNPHDILVATLSRPPIPPRSLRPELSEAMESLLSIALAKSPTERFANAGEFLEYLTAAAVGSVPENSRPLPTASSGQWSLGQQPGLPLKNAAPNDETRALSKPKIASDISELLRIDPSFATLGDAPVVLDTPGHTTSRASEFWSDAPLGSLDPVDLALDPNARPTPSDAARHTRPAPMFEKESGSGLELDIEKIQRSGVPLPSWSEAPSHQRQTQHEPDWKAWLTAPLQRLVRPRSKASRPPSRYRRLARMAIGVVVGLIAVKLLITWFVQPALIVEIAPSSDTSAASNRMPTAQIAPPPHLNDPSRNKPVDQVTIWIDATPRNVKITWGGTELSERPLVVSRGEESIDMVISAPGYKTARIKVVPSQAQNVRIELEAVKGTRKPPARRRR